jgi:hypothetical protein
MADKQLKKPIAMASIDVEDDIEDLEEEEENSEPVVPVAPIVNEHKLPEGYTYKDFLRLNGPNTFFRNKGNGSNISRNYPHGSMVPVDLAPTAMRELADNPKRTCINPENGKMMYYVETIRRIIKTQVERKNTSVINTEGGEVPYIVPDDPLTHLSSQPLRPEQVILRGLQANADAKMAEKAAAKAKK